MLRVARNALNEEAAKLHGFVGARHDAGRLPPDTASRLYGIIPWYEPRALLHGSLPPFVPAALPPFLPTAHPPSPTRARAELLCV